MSEPFKGRFSRLRVAPDLTATKPHHHYFEMREGGAAIPDQPEGDGVIDHLISKGDARVEQAKQLWHDLTKREDVMMTWLEESAQNAELFFNDPVSAIKKVMPELKNELLNK